jgi:hypothetical protein
MWVSWGLQNCNPQRRIRVIIMYGKILKKGDRDPLHGWKKDICNIYGYLIILDPHLCPCTFVIVRADSSEFKTPEMKEARLLEKSQERCQWTGYRLLVNPWPQTRPVHLRGNNGNRHILFDPTEFPRSESWYVC